LLDETLCDRHLCDRIQIFDHSINGSIPSGDENSFQVASRCTEGDVGDRNIF
jgi:hypothetical protein